MPFLFQANSPCAPFSPPYSGRCPRLLLIRAVRPGDQRRWWRDRPHVHGQGGDLCQLRQPGQTACRGARGTRRCQVKARPGVGVAACSVAAARTADGGWWAPATVAGLVVRLARGVADGEEDTGARVGGAAAREADALATASLWPPSTTASVIATPAAVRTPPATTAPARKLTSSMRA